MYWRNSSHACSHQIVTSTNHFSGCTSMTGRRVFSTDGYITRWLCSDSARYTTAARCTGLRVSEIPDRTAYAPLPRLTVSVTGWQHVLSPSRAGGGRVQPAPGTGRAPEHAGHALPARWARERLPRGSRGHLQVTDRETGCCGRWTCSTQMGWISGGGRLRVASEMTFSTAPLARL